MKKAETIHDWEQLSQEFGDDLDAEAMTALLDEYTVDFPPEHVIEKAIETCLYYMPAYAPKTTTYAVRVKRWLHSLSVQTRYVEPWFWLLTLLLFVGGYAITVSGSISPYQTLLVLSPMPMVFGTLEVLRSLDTGMAEMELTSKFSLPQIVMARVVVIGSYNIVLNTMSAVILHWTVVGSDLWKMGLFWFVPFTWTAGVMLFLASRVRGRYLAPIALLVWSIAGTLLSNSRILPYLLSLNDTVFVVLGLTGLTLLWAECRQLCNRLERGIFVEITG